MKILFIINHLNAGGAEKILSVLANSFSAMGKEVVIATVSQNEPFYVLSEKVKLVHIKRKKVLLPLVSKVMTPFHFIFAIKNMIKMVQPDIVISFTTTMNVYSILAVKMSRIPIIVSEHTNFHRAKNTFWRYMRQIIYPFADTLVVLTDYDKEKYRLIKRVVRIHNPLVLENRHINVNREKIILAVGRLHTVKGFDLLLRSFARLNHGEWKLVILGEGSQRMHLESLVKELKIADKVDMPGLMKDVELFYKKASIFVLSSRAEGFPGTLCEAMGYGCAVVAYDCLTGPKDIITHGVDGFLVEAENITALTESMQHLIDNTSKINLVGKQATNIVKRLDVETITKEWIDIMDSLVKKEIKDD